MVVSDWSELKQKKIALFVGADVLAHSVLNEVVGDMVARGYEPIIYLPDHIIPTNKPDAFQKELREAAFFERQLTNNVIYPFLEKNVYPLIEGKEDETPEVLSPERLAQKYKLPAPVRVERVNNGEFIRNLSDETNLVGMISIRCFQIFSKNFIKSFTESPEGRKRFLFNLHPGKLPEFKGVLSTARAMDHFAQSANSKGYAAGDKMGVCGWTLHEIDAGIDTGAVLWNSLKPLDMNASAFKNGLSTVELGANSIRRALAELDEGNILSGVSQGAHRDKFYHTYPTPRRMAIWKEKGIQLVDPFNDYKCIVNKFGPVAADKKEELTAEVLRAVHAWYAVNDPIAAGNRCKTSRAVCGVRGKTALSTPAIIAHQEPSEISFKL